jgi:uncharacterized membrane protein YjgN (DUF898 family)
MLPTQISPVHSAKQISSTRGRGHRLLLAIVTFVLVVISVAGIQVIANRLSAPRAAVGVEALGASPAAAAQQPGLGMGALVVALLVLLAGVRLVSRLRTASAKHRYWDDMPW